EPVEVTFDVHRLRAIDNPDGAAPLTEREHHASITRTVTTNGDGVATFEYYATASDGPLPQFPSESDLGPLGYPEDSATHPTVDAADRDHIVACVDPVEGTCSQVIEGEPTDRAEVVVLEGVERSDRVVNQWVISDATSGLGGEVLPGSGGALL